MNSIFHYPDYTITCNTDLDGARMIIAHRDMFCAIHDAKEIIRSRLKYHEPSEEETKTLESLQEALYLPCIECIS